MNKHYDNYLCRTRSAQKPYIYVNKRGRRFVYIKGKPHLLLDYLSEDFNFIRFSPMPVRESLWQRFKNIFHLPS